jgi:hypothetical protein
MGGRIRLGTSAFASNARDRLFRDHNVIEDSDLWIYREAISASVAREVEKAYLAVGCDGGSAGGDASTVYVYAYRKTRSTNP